MKPKYDAFISYNRDPNKNLASKLEDALENLGSGWLIFKFWGLRIFLDETKFAGYASLDEKIIQAIKKSEFLILLASSQGKENYLNSEIKKEDWVELENEMWIRTKPEEIDQEGKRKNPKIIICVTDGDIRWDKELCDFDWTITNCLPACLKGQFSRTPHWIDFRGIKKKSIKTPETLSLEFPDFKQKVAEVFSQIQDIPVDDLIAKDRNYKRIGRLVLSCSILILLGLLAYANGQKNLADIQRDFAVAQKNIATKRLQEYDSIRLGEAIQNSKIYFEAQTFERADSALQIAEFICNQYDSLTSFSTKKNEIDNLRSIYKKK